VRADALADELERERARADRAEAGRDAERARSEALRERLDELQALVSCYTFQLESILIKLATIMARGGRRPGAGRKAMYGWKPAVLKMRSASVEAKARIIANPDRDPLNYLVDLANDETAPRSDRIICARPW
jgi:hypothetical protein